MAPNGFVLSRRAFLGVAAGTLALPACLTDFTTPSGSALLLARPGDPIEEGIPGMTALNLGEARDGFLYVPAGYDPAVAASLVVLLHGSGDGSSFWTRPDFAIQQLADDRGLVILAPESRDVSWDVVLHHRFGADPQFIDRALALTFSRCRIDPARVGLVGFSDGGTTALSLGLQNGHLFTQVGAFSPGFVAAGDRSGKPHVFMSHGIRDGVLGINAASRTIVPKLRQQGYQVEYQEFEGVHEVPMDKLTRALDRVAGAL